MRAEVSRSAGPDVGVKSMQQRKIFEIKDLDEWSTEEEIIGAVASYAGAERSSIRVISLRKRYAGSQSAIVLAEPRTVTKVIDDRRLRIGMVSCRVFQGEQKIRCFRCHSFGHLARDCTGPDRSQCCMKCGVSGHKMVNCEATIDEAKVFARLIAQGGTSSTVVQQTEISTKRTQ